MQKVYVWVDGVLMTVIHKLIWYKALEVGLDQPIEGLLIVLVFVVLITSIIYGMYGCATWIRKIL